jgi:hypothetical protein
MYVDRKERKSSAGYLIYPRKRYITEQSVLFVYCQVHLPLLKNRAIDNFSSHVFSVEGHYGTLGYHGQVIFPLSPPQYAPVGGQIYLRIANTDPLHTGISTMLKWHSLSKKQLHPVHNSPYECNLIPNLG